MKTYNEKLEELREDWLNDGIFNTLYLDRAHSLGWLDCRNAVQELVENEIATFGYINKERLLYKLERFFKRDQVKHILYK